ncbi:MAG: XdhC family protein [Thermoleophilia bacterium]|jgi:xanthine dehydrogenase accessory factor|nr:XdhC family protein [Thermoleophilia bacterium]
MISADLLRRSQELAAAREPFVTATVVRVQHPTSVETGSVALVLGDGTIEGFVGGVCAEQSVRAYSLVALETGEPVLLRILPDPGGSEAAAEPPETPAAVEDGVVTVENPCLSGGAIELFLEPAPPAPRVLIVGDTPIARAALRIGEELGFAMVSSDGHDPEPAASDLGLVVAAHGRDELHALRRGLEAGLPYVGLVASDKRGAGVLDELRADGVGEELLVRIDVPAGIPIGSRTGSEIALSILAKVVSVRREGTDAQTAAQSAPAPVKSDPPADAAASAAQATVAPSPSVAIDPICGMTVAAVEGTPSLERDGETVYFCCEGCKEQFEARGEHASVAS